MKLPRFTLRDLFWLVLVVALSLAFGIGGAPGQHPAVSEPETKDIVAGASGYLVHTNLRREIVVISLPAMKRTVVHRTAAEDAELYPTIHAMSGPDSKGRIAYIEDHFFVADEKDRKHLLKTINIDGTGIKEFFSRPGDAMWATTRIGSGKIGTHLALSPSGGKVALLTDLTERQMPRALLHEGKIEIWDTEKKVALHVRAKAIDQPLSWFPDGKRLVYVRLVPRDELPKDAPGLERFGEYFGERWEAVPAVYVLSIETGETKFLHVGWTPVVSHNGRTVLIGGWGNLGKFSWNRFDLESRASSPVKWPGDAGGAIAMPAENIVLYKGLGTAGEVGDPKRILTLKVARLDSDEFQTIVADFGSHDLVSFGRVLEKE